VVVILDVIEEKRVVVESEGTPSSGATEDWK